MKIEDDTFVYCDSLTSVIIPNSVIKIGAAAFSHCYALTSIVIPDSVKEIGDYAFDYCCGLASITIPTSVTKIGHHAFTWVNNIVYKGKATGTPWEAKCINGYVEGNLIFSDASKTKLCGCSSAAEGIVTIPDSVIEIGKYAFGFCRELTSVTIPTSVTKIGDRALIKCSGLTSIMIQNSIIEIEDGAFEYCSGLQEIIVPLGQKFRFSQMEGLKDLEDKIIEREL